MDRRRSLKDSSGTVLMDSDRSLDNIPSYADERLRTKLDETSRKEEMDRRNKALENEKKEKAIYKQSLVKFSNINDFLLLTMGVAIMGLIASLVYIKINYAIYSLLTAFLSYYIGRRLRPINNEDGILNTLVWNLALSINDFFEYKIDYSNLSNYRKDVNKISIVFALVVSLFNSTSVVYPVALIALIIMYIISLSQRDKDCIIGSSKIVLSGLVYGFVFKGIVHTCVSGVLSLDLFNLVLTIGLVCIYHILKSIDLTEPKQ